MRLHVRVYLRSSRNAIAWSDDQGFKVRVTAVPEDGKANAALLELLADRLKIPRSSIRIVRGRRTRDKVVQLDGLTSEDLTRLGGTAGRK